MSFSTKSIDVGAIVGKRIRAVVLKQRKRSAPPAQLYLVFSDGSVYEFYGEIHPTTALRIGGEDVALALAGREGEVTVMRFPDRRALAKLIGRRDRRRLSRISASRRTVDAS